MGLHKQDFFPDETIKIIFCINRQHVIVFVYGKQFFKAKVKGIFSLHSEYECIH